MREPTRAEVERGTAALLPFVTAWGLGLNPDDLSLLAAAVLSTFDGQEDPGEIASRVERWLAIEREDRRRMHETWALSAGLPASADPPQPWVQ